VARPGPDLVLLTHQQDMEKVAHARLTVKGLVRLDEVYRAGSYPRLITHAVTGRGADLPVLLGQSRRSDLLLR
jgi:hypothetical protein